MDTDELFARALREIAELDEDAPMPSLVALQGRPGRDVFERAARLVSAEDADERELGVRILRELGTYDEEGRRPFTAETVPLILREMRDEPDPWVLSWMISALGYHFACETLDLVLSFQERPEQPLRFAVAAALPALADPDRTEQRVIDALLRLGQDENDSVRWYALYALFNETVGVAAAAKLEWAAALARLADAERREELRHLAGALDDDEDPRLRALLAG